MNTVTIDWIAFTAKELNNEPQTVLRSFTDDNETYPDKPTNGYNQCERTKTGVLLNWHTVRKEMGYHFIVSGSALRNICECFNIDQKEVLRKCADITLNFTRLDLAKDVQDVSVNLDSIYKDVEFGKGKGTARTVNQIHSTKGGNTVYIGSRTSERFLRLYNKGSQMEVDREWYRMEIESKGMVARAMAYSLLSGDDWSNAFDTTAKAMLDLPSNRSYNQFFDPNGCKIGFPKIERHTDREKWINDQVIPSVTKHFVEFPNSEAVKLLRNMLDLIDRQRNL